MENVPLKALIQWITRCSAHGETGTMEGKGGPEMTHGSKSSKSSKEDKNTTPIKPCWRKQQSGYFQSRWPNGGYLFWEVRIRSGEGVFWKAIWENQMKRLVLANAWGLRETGAGAVKHDKDSRADYLLLTAFHKQKEAETGRAHRIRKKGVKIHQELYRPGHKGSHVLCEKAELKG